MAACRQVAETSAEQKASETFTREVNLTPQQRAKAAIVTGPLEQKKIHSSITVNGVVDVPPQNIISVSFPLGGYLRHTKLIPGMPIRKGEVIAEIEDPAIVQLQQDYLVTAARLSYLEKELNRQKSLNADKVSADKVLEQVSSEHASQRAILSALSEKLRMIGLQPEILRSDSITRMVCLRSPIHGFVSKVNVNIGKYVQPQDVLFELINPDDIHAALSIFEKDIPRVQVGQTVSISFVDEPETSYEGEVILLNHHVDNDRVALAHCHFHSKPARLLPGMYLNARIYLQASAIPSLPEQAIVRYRDQDYVFVEVDAHRFSLQPVRTGIHSDGQVEILDASHELHKYKIVKINAYSLLGSMMNRAEGP